MKTKLLVLLAIALIAAVEVSAKDSNEYAESCFAIVWKEEIRSSGKNKHTFMPLYLQKTITTGWSDMGVSYRNAYFYDGEDKELLQDPIYSYVSIDRHEVLPDENHSIVLHIRPDTSSSKFDSRLTIRVEVFFNRKLAMITHNHINNNIRRVVPLWRFTKDIDKWGGFDREIKKHADVDLDSPPRTDKEEEGDTQKTPVVRTGKEIEFILKEDHVEIRWDWDTGWLQRSPNLVDWLDVSWNKIENEGVAVYPITYSSKMFFRIEPSN